MITKNHKPLTAIDVMKKELWRIQSEQALLVDQYDIVYSHSREKYNLLTKEVKKYQDAITKLEDLKNGKS